MLIANEWRYLIHQPLFWLACLLVPSVSYLFTSGLTSEAPSVVLQLQLKYVALTMLVLPVYMTIMLPMYFCRDHIHQSFEIITVTATSWRRRILSRVTTFVLATFVLFVMSFVLITVLSTAFGFGLNSSETMDLPVITVFGGLAQYCVSVLLPSITLFTVIGAVLSARQVPVFTFYLLGITVLVGYLVVASITGNPILAGSKIISDDFYQVWQWADPYGLTALVADWESSYNNYVFWLNRAFVTGLLLLLLSRRFLKENLRENLSESLSEKNAKRTLVKGTNADNTVSNKVKSSPWLELSCRHVLLVCSNKANLIVMTLWPLLIFNEVLSGIDYVEPFSVVLPTSLDAINRINSDILPVFGSLLVVLWTWQIVGSTKSHQFHEIFAATPLANRTILSAQLTAMLIIVMIVLVLTLFGCLLAEWIAGSELAPVIYITELSVIGLSLSLLGALSISVMHVCSNRSVGTSILIGLLLLKFTPISGTLGMTHTLWNVAGTPLQSADNFWGYADSGTVWWPYIKVWLAVVVASLIVAVCMTHRGIFVSSTRRIWASSNRIKQRVPFVLMALSIMFAGFMVVDLHSKIVKQKPLTFSSHREEWKAQYELAYQHWSVKPQPTINHVEANIDIYPHEQRALFRLNIRAKNKTSQPVDQILLGRYGNMSSFVVNEVRLIASDNTWQTSQFTSQTESTVANQHVIQLDTPLESQQELQISVSFEYQQPTLWPVSSSSFIKPDLAFLRGVPLMPEIGFQQEWVLKDKALRSHFELPPRWIVKPSNLLKLDDNNTQPDALLLTQYIPREEYNWVTYQSTVSTRFDHHVVAPGILTDSSIKGARKTFHYQASTPMRNLPAWLSIPIDQYQVHQRDNVEVYVPTLSYFNGDSAISSDAIDVNLNAVSDTMTWLSQEVSPYRYSKLRLFAMPDSGPTGFALPQTILIGFKVGFLAQPARNDSLQIVGFDQRYRRAVHETAHQWFGHDIGNGSGTRVDADRAFLVESLAKYAELVMVEQHYGFEAKEALVNYEQRRFDNAQRFNYAEPLSLVDATSNHQQYSQATLVFNELRNTLGDPVILAALRDVWSQYGFDAVQRASGKAKSTSRPALSIDFVRALQRQVSDNPAHIELIERLLLGLPKR